MLGKMGMNVVFLCCMALLSAVGAVNYPPQAGAQGVDSYTKLMLHADGSDQGTSFTDSSATPKTVINTETYDSATKLMLHMEGSGASFTDSATSKTVTTNNDVTQTTAQYKLGSKSGVFDGSGDYLSLADSDDWNFGTGDFTIDLWVRFNALPSNTFMHVYSQYQNSSNYQALYLRDISGTKYWYWSFLSTGAQGNITMNGDAAVTILVNTWYHIALVRNGNNWRVYQDGINIGDEDNIAYTVADYAAAWNIGGNPYVDYLAFNGWLDELRISKGIARWTSDFTPPSSPYGKVYTVTGTKKFGTASGEFKGSGDYLTLADSDDWNFGTGDFTVDCWVKFNALADTVLVSQVNVSGGTNERGINVRWQVANTLGIQYTTDGTTATNHTFDVSWVPSLSTWYHVAVVRNGADLKFFVDGTQLGVTQNVSTDTLYNSNRVLYIGATDSNPGTVQSLNGYLDELRISKGIARWTSNFTPPTAPYETDTTLPTVSSTSPASGATVVGVGSAISATFSEDMDSSTITTSTFTLSSSSGGSVSGNSVGWVKRSAPNKTEDDKDGFASLNPSYTTTASTFTPSSSISGTVSYSNKVATFTPSSSLSYSTTYTATITTGVKDISGNAMSSNYSWSFTTGSAPDTTAPSGSIVINSGASYTNSTAVTLTLSATDTTGVTGYYVSDSSTTPSSSASGWTSVTSTTSYSASVSYSLSGGEGSKTIYAWYKDAAGNVSTTANATITLDTTVPTVTISSPTSSSTYTATSSTISLGGSASDSSSGISSVSWSNNRGGNGTATGTASWTISGISLSTGDNVITVTAKDGANNSGTDTLQVTYSTGSTISAPTVSTGSASNVTTSSATLNGTVNANGASTTAWFQYGTTSGSYGNTSSTQTVTGSSNTTVSIGISGLSSGTKYYYRIAASNSGGTSYGSESSFTTSTTTATPTPTPSPTATTTPKPSPTAQPTPTLPPLPTPQPSPSPANEGIVFGIVNDLDENALQGVEVSIFGSGYSNNTETDNRGYYEFRNLEAGSYTLTYEEDGYKTQTKGVTLGEGEENDLGTVILEEEEEEIVGKIYGYVVDIRGDPIESVRVNLKGIKTKVKSTESSDADGFFEFSDLGVDTYVLTAKKKRYRNNKQRVTLEDGESEEIEIEMRKTNKRIKGL